MLVDLYIREGLLPRPAQVSFARDIHPILDRLSGLQWVNKAFAAVFGRGAPFDFADPVLLDRVARVHGAADVYKPLRLSIQNMFRDPSADRTDVLTTLPDPGAWPWLYGDSFDATPGDTDPNQYLAPDAEWLRRLDAWANGAFIPDWPPPPRPADIDGYPLPEQPMALDRAALDFCAADAFHPGIELTWPMRHMSIYSEPFRIRRQEEAEPNYGPTLDVPTVLGAHGPLHGQFAGSLSRWMLVPWQIDTGGCLSGYDERQWSDAPSFWPARVPNAVLSRENYRRAVDPTLSHDERVTAFAERRSWFDRLGTDPLLIGEFGAMGVLELLGANCRRMACTTRARSPSSRPPTPTKSSLPSNEESIH